ncbi:CRISPR-associated protein [Marinobacterium aestuarii]|uniref:CRISPR-associated protein n=1 Tax=Marinobacterium aestuarii TaxID=1821621 RepID=A0A1A9EWC5_9GAMM|nr:TIGR02221 family CRISPR-associated protein [Marinobacterium aestuarii]ANG62216.1 CRISPR-associated protein [Marinobacterium aestuarii]
MKKTLITFLGRTRKTEQGYNKTAYVIDGETHEPSAFLGFNLQRHLKPQRLVVMGTAGSMWDHLFDGDINLGDLAEDERLTLADAVENQAVTQQQLDSLRHLLEERLDTEVRLQIIPYGHDLAEQVRLVELMANHVQSQDKVHLDVTHGFRNLPMVALLAAMYLREIRQARIEGIWYAAYDPGKPSTTVNNIEGLLRVADWLTAMSSYTKDGDYGVFGKLLGKSAHLLKSAAYFERTSNPAKARECLSSWTIADNYPDDPVASLFADELQRRIDWHKSQSRPDYEKHLACEYLNRRDYLRAAIFGLESKITEQTYTQKLPDDYARRKEVSEQLKQSADFSTLNNMRNALAHGLRSPDPALDRLLANEDKLQAELRRLFKALKITSPAT